MKITDGKKVFEVSNLDAVNLVNTGKYELDKGESEENKKLFKAVWSKVAKYNKPVIKEDHEVKESDKAGKRKSKAKK